MPKESFFEIQTVVLSRIEHAESCLCSYAGWRVTIISGQKPVPTESIRKLNSNQSWNNENQTKILSTLPITKEQKLSNAMAQDKILRWNNDINSSTPYPFFYHTVRQTKLKGHPSIWLMFQLTLRSKLQLLYYKRRGHKCTCLITKTVAFRNQGQTKCCKWMDNIYLRASSSDCLTPNPWK